MAKEYVIGDPFRVPAKLRQLIRCRPATKALNSQVLEFRGEFTTTSAPLLISSQGAILRQLEGHLGDD